MPTQNNCIDNDEDKLEYDLVPRRLSERRESTRRDSLPKLAPPEQIKQLRELDEAADVTIRVDERRNLKRRVSKPALLSVEEIQLRRKT